MHLYAAFLALGLSALSITPANAVQSSNETHGGYIVTFKSSDTRPSFVTANNTKVLYHYDIINGVAANFTNEQIEELRADPNVDGIYEDSIMELDAIQTNATWGLARLSSKAKLQYKRITATNFTFHYNKNAGHNVDIYVVDSGIHVNHADFGGRARWGATFGGFPDTDNDGHGTHCAGLAASSTYGVAKQANIIAVKVAEKKLKRTARTSDLISGLQYVYNSVKRSGRRSVVSMSISGPANTAIDDAVVKLTRDKIIFVCSAGNKGREASRYSPARVPSAITVASSDINDKQAETSNFGFAVDIVAPGRSIRSTWIGGKHATAVKSGTSMSTAYVAGLVATFLTFGKYTPAEMQVFLDNHAQKGVLSNMSPNTPNLLASNGLLEDN